MKDYENLIIADYICRGINSPKVWRKYLDSFEERYGSKVVYCKAKSKEYGWRNLTQKVILANGKAYYETRGQSNFTKGYLRTGVFCRPSCYECKFKGYPRIADITLADFWGIENVNTSMEKNLGTSLVMINSKKGEAYFEGVKKRINYVPVPFDSIEAGNQALNKPLDSPKVDRKAFFKDLDKMSFNELSEKYEFTPRSKPATWKMRLKHKKNYLHHILSVTQYSPKALYQFCKFNTIEEIMHENVIIPTPHTIIDVMEGGKIIKHGISIIGGKKFPKSKLETRILVDRNGVLEFGPNTSIGYGSDIEVFPNACLHFKGHGGANMGLTIICQDRIEIGSQTMIGRNVTIRDNNGNHYINRNGYKNSRPLLIGDKVWLCEQCIIMPGAKIGDGVIVGAASVVVSHIPSNTMTFGNPARIVDEEILWKY